MDDAELTRLAIAEIVREMGEVKEPAVQERKINPIAKPNKRFLGRTLNSVLSHNKRKNDRTQENCRKKLRELDERREIIKRMRSRSRSGSWELVLSSSSDEDHSKEVKKSRKHERKTKYNKHKKSKKRKSRSKKDKRRYSSSSSSSSDSSSDSSSSTSRNSCRKRKSKPRKRAKPKTRKIAQPVINTMEAGTEEIYYEPDINAAIEFDAALMANNYRQHQIQQLLYFNTLMAGHETFEIEALKEELRISDAEVTETQKEKVSISSAVSSLNLNESDSDVSEVLQISLSSATSSGSEAKSNASIRKKKVKRKVPKVGLPIHSSDGSRFEVILELDSDSSNGDKISEINAVTEKQPENDECICITSESETTTDDDSESESSTSEKDNESTNNTNEPNTLSHAAAETVTLLSSSDSEVEIITLNGADESAQKPPDRVLTVITSQYTDLTSACEKQSDLVLCVSEKDPNSILGESLSLNGADESTQKLPDPVKAADQPAVLTAACEKQSDLVTCVSETNAISIPEESLTLNVADESAQKLPDRILTVITSQSTDSPCACEKQSDLVLCGSETDENSISEENLTLNSADESAQKLPDTVMTATQSTNLTPVCKKQLDLVIYVSETNANLMPNESLSTVLEGSIVRVPEKNTNLSVEVNSLITPTTETEMPKSAAQAQHALINENEPLEVSESTALTLVAPTEPVANAICESNSSDIKTAGTNVVTTANIDQEYKKSDDEMSSKVVNVLIKESVDGIPHVLPPSSLIDQSVSSSPEEISVPPITTIDKTELELGLIQNQSIITAPESVDEQISA